MYIELIDEKRQYSIYINSIYTFSLYIKLVRFSIAITNLTSLCIRRSIIYKPMNKIYTRFNSISTL